MKDLLSPRQLEQLSQLANRLKQKLPGRESQAVMAPRHAYGRHHIHPFPDVRRAAVAIVLFPAADSWRLPLTKRPETLPHHPGQVCLPGGMCDEGETLLQCARRELEEELGVSRELPLQELGTLTPLYVFGTNFLVEPFVFATEQVPQWQPSPAEVDRLLLPGIDQFSDSRVREVELQRGGVEWRTPSWEIEGETLWGATAMILNEFYAVWRNGHTAASD